jgi:glycopeptide antibiotics resistance protein
MMLRRFLIWLASPAGRVPANMLLLLYLGTLLWMVVFKGLKVLDLESPQVRWADISFDQGALSPVPGVSLLYYFTFREKYTNGLFNIGGNLLAFMPLGALLPLATPYFRKASRVGGAALLLSGAIELVQWMTATGTCETDDLLLNGAGALIGFMLLRYCLLRSWFQGEDPGKAV